MDKPIAAALKNDIKNLPKQDDDKIPFILLREYGRLLPTLEQKHWMAREVNKNDLVFGAENHYRKLDNAVVDYYQNYPKDLPRGICLPDGERFRIIDGYHRCSAAEEKLILFVGV